MGIEIGGKKVGGGGEGCEWGGWVGRISKQEGSKEDGTSLLEPICSNAYFPDGFLHEAGL